MKNKIENLQELLKLEIPKSEYPEDGFLEIIKKSHRETINSNIYAYFLNVDNNKAIASLFFESLIAIIHMDEKEIKSSDFDSYNVDTEVKTDKGYIDIVIDDGKRAVIIENKLYHHLHNPLKDYWNHYPDNEYSKKIGLLLTLETKPIPDEVKGKFINIKHIDWINEIRRRGLPSGLPHKMYIYLNDFFQTIENHTKSNIMNEETRFYFDHTAKIEAAISCKEQAQEFVWNQMVKLSGILDLEIYQHTKTRYEFLHFWDQKNHKDIYYTVYIKELMDGKNKLTIIIEVSDTLAKPEALTKIKQLDLIHHLDVSNKVDGYIAHFLFKEYNVTSKDIERLADFILEKIKDDFEKVFDTLVAHCYVNGNLLEIKDKLVKEATK